ncbi:unnamed protein product [Ambrosiozyma monospora]|uniref:Unnamed protein product n=1 Tax=Ambrosiozyma monospora TaxID=43982 RepID=A0A9W6YUJ7_AMBMO|nr:unnamed protein product [Ambrosiozyma monospora]
MRIPPIFATIYYLLHILHTSASLRIPSKAISFVPKLPKLALSAINHFSDSQETQLYKVHTNSISAINQHQLIVQGKLAPLGLDVLATELNSFSVHQPKENEAKNAISGIMLSKGMLNKNGYSKLGLINAAKSSFQFDLQETGLQGESIHDLDQMSLQFPQGTQCLFLFNTDNQTRFNIQNPKTWSFMNKETDFKIVDYGLLMSLNYLKSVGDFGSVLGGGDYSKFQLSAQNKDVFYYRHPEGNPLSLESPVLVVLLQENKMEMTNENGKAEASAVRKKKVKLFEMFTKIWLKSHPVFRIEDFVVCSVNELKNSYCLKANKHKSLEFFSTFLSDGHVDYNTAFAEKGKQNVKTGHPYIKRSINETELVPQFSSLSSLLEDLEANKNQQGSVNENQSSVNIMQANHKALSKQEQISKTPFEIQLSNPKLEYNEKHYKNITRSHEVEQFKSNLNNDIPINLLSVDDEMNTLNEVETLNIKGYKSPQNKNSGKHYGARNSKYSQVILESAV